jgi:hypothetical protein
MLPQLRNADVLFNARQYRSQTALTVSRLHMLGTMRMYCIVPHNNVYKPYQTILWWCFYGHHQLLEA